MVLSMGKVINQGFGYPKNFRQTNPIITVWTKSHVFYVESYEQGQRCSVHWQYTHISAKPHIKVPK